MKVVTNTIFLLLVLTSILANADYTPVDSILLNCGSTSDDLDIDGRKWSGDSSMKPLLTSTKSSAATAKSQDPSLPSAVPYMTATVFQAKSTYKFKVSKTDRHWVRLHFYPSTYNNLNAENSYFNVTTSGGITLLRNFSAYITATAMSQAYLIKEFSLVPSRDGTLTLTFIPTGSKYAFVNGIEIISMPDIFSQPASMVGVNAGMDLTASALETNYRVNVGGQYISPPNDTGLSRTWYDDSFYIYGASTGVTPSDDQYPIQYPTKESRYIAPDIVYMTARSMGPDKDININYNLTWVFQVDANFTYVVRMHFCEIVNSSFRVNARVFDIYINNQTAQAGADVIGWASKMYVPVYKDYAVYVSDTPGDDMLWVALHPSMESKPEFYDAILNGLEIFKVNDTTGNLAGPNPIPIPIQVEGNEAGIANKFGGHDKIIGGTAGGVAGVALAFVIGIAVYKRKKKVLSSQSSGNSGWLPLYGNSHNTTNSKSTISGKSTTSSSHVSSMAASMCRHFSIAEIRQGTKSFDESLVIGVGGFGKVYRGVVDGSMKVAIKRSNPSSQQGVNEFQTEIEMLSMLRHKHLVSLIGYCEEDGEMCLVYDFMANGTLREHLYKTNKPPLSWKQRLEICIGAARGLHYLHTGAKYTIIHRDVKTTNILLDENFVAKVSDFGLSKTGPTINETHVSTVVKGSFGYLDPEYFRRQQLTEKSDVYSFGVVLFEVLCARPVLDPSLSREQVSLADWALHCKRKGTLGDTIDPIIKGTINPEVLNKFTETAVKCLSDHGAQRPSMGDVLWTLDFALQLTENSKGGGFSTNSTESVSDDGCTGGHARLGSVAGSEAGSEAEVVFSQLVDPKGR